ncbi:MAG: metal-dependent phosphohydrolase protein [Proteobacteria bacterium]|nr:metal-dependent phosphohydrolase protein [Pseudomonadota bacterium]
MAKKRPQRVRDPLHNIIEFGSSEFEQTLWNVIQTRPFQRLRRVRQLGFSELVYPGATHTRFAHSIGVFHTARRLMKIINDAGGGVTHKQDVALAAALVHDVGHGMFSHAFEEVGSELKLKMAKHEHVSDILIRNGEIREAFKAELGSGFADDVAELISRRGPVDLYDAVVSSQFDADRLDYMQRDRLMTGVQNSGIDFTWLIDNLELGEVPVGSDDEQSGSVPTFVLGPKAFHAAETYVLSLFHLYPTVYFHKATRGAEKLFSTIILRMFRLVRDGLIAKTGVPANHPIVLFALDPENIERATALDDAVFWGSLPLLANAEDPLINRFADRLWNRRLLKCLDVYQHIAAHLGAKRGSSPDAVRDSKNRIERATVSVKEAIEDWLSTDRSDPPRLLIDSAVREPYKLFDESKGALNQISIRRKGSGIFDMAELSPVVAALEPFRLLRIYYSEDDKDALKFALKVIEENENKESDHVC